MTERPPLQLTGTVLGAPDPKLLGEFYARLLGWQIRADEPGWVALEAPDGGAGLAFQEEDAYVRPVWPAGSGDQQMQLHLDIEVQDLAAAVAWALESGATLAEHQPQEDVRICLDPDGHPFCLWVAT